MFKVKLKFQKANESTILLKAGNKPKGYLQRVKEGWWIVKVYGYHSTQATTLAVAKDVARSLAE